MFIPATIPKSFLVLSGKKHCIANILAVVQNRSTVLVALVVPIHHRGLLSGIHRIIVDVFAHIQGDATGFVLQLRVLLFQLFVIYQLHMEQVSGLLDIGDTTFPE